MPRKSKLTIEELIVELTYIERPTIVLKLQGRLANRAEQLRAAILAVAPEVRFLPHASGKLTIIVRDTASYENAYAAVSGVVVDFARS